MHGVAMIPYLRSVFYPSDFVADEQPAFEHALKVALAARGRLDLFHVVRPEEDYDVSLFPSVRSTLERWGAIPLDPRRRPSRDTGLEVRRVHARSQGVSATIEEHVAAAAPDLLLWHPINARARIGGCTIPWPSRGTGMPCATLLGPAPPATGSCPRKPAMPWSARSWFPWITSRAPSRFARGGAAPDAGDRGRPFHLVARGPRMAHAPRPGVLRAPASPTRSRHGRATSWITSWPRRGQ
jgi:hypothetical protein